MYLKKNIVLQFLWNIEHNLWKGTSWTWLNSSVIPTIFQGFEYICDADHILIFLWHWFSYLWHWLIDLRATLNMPLGSEESVECSEEQGGVFCISLFFFSLFFLLFLNFSLPLFTWLTKVSPPPPAWTWCAASWPPSTPCWWQASCSTSPAYPSTCSAGAQCHLEIQIFTKLGQGSQPDHCNHFRHNPQDLRPQLIHHSSEPNPVSFS